MDYRQRPGHELKITIYWKEFNETELLGLRSGSFIHLGI